MSESGAAPIDFAHLARYTGGDPATDAEILRLFRAQIDACLAQLRAAHGRGDAALWRQAAHTLKGAARGVGAGRLGDGAAALEHLGDAPPEEREAALTALDGPADTVAMFIDAWLKRAAA